MPCAAQDLGQVLAGHLSVGVPASEDRSRDELGVFPFLLSTLKSLWEKRQNQPLVSAYPQFLWGPQDWQPSATQTSFTQWVPCS